MPQLPLLFPKLRVEIQKYRSKGKGKQEYPKRDVQAHSARLLTNISEVFANNELRNTQCIRAGLQAKEGIYLGINGEPGYSLKIESLHSDLGNYQLLNVRNVTNDYGKMICATIY
ncbi:MAG: hypothetical protein J5846_02265, partial [Desulfovibrio sp.]|nr:hypothetical protein [Desulfovibrio sp.]